MRLPTLHLTIAVLLLAGCHQAKSPQASAQDIEAARQDAQHEIDEARKEASKDVKSAAKTMGSDSKGVLEAKVTGKYDVAMAQADGAHKVALEKCTTLSADLQKSCKDQADADYDTAAAAAKATRLAKQP